jgi:hypothetical protein
VGYKVIDKHRSVSDGLIEQPYLFISIRAVVGPFNEFLSPKLCLCYWQFATRSGLIVVDHLRGCFGRRTGAPCFRRSNRFGCEVRCSGTDWPDFH